MDLCPGSPCSKWDNPNASARTRCPSSLRGTCMDSSPAVWWADSSVYKEKCAGRNVSLGNVPLWLWEKRVLTKLTFCWCFSPLSIGLCMMFPVVANIQEQEETFSLLKFLHHRNWEVNWDWEGAKVLGNLWGEVQPKTTLAAVGAALWGVKSRVHYRTMHWRVGQPVMLLAWERAKCKSMLPDLNSFSRCKSTVRKSCFFTLLDLCACTQWA